MAKANIVTWSQSYSVGINLIDGGHYSTENVVVPVLAQRIKSEFPELNVMISKRHKQVVEFI